MRVAEEIRSLIVRLWKEGKSQRNIGEIVKKPRSTVQSFIKKYQTTKKVADKPRTGRPNKIQVLHRRAILRRDIQNPKISAPKLAGMLQNDYNLKVDPETIRITLRRAGYNGRVPLKKPYISKVNKAKQLHFAKLYINEPQTFWESVLFTDESKFNVFSSGGRVKVWRKPNKAFKKQNLCTTVKHGGGIVLVWGCMSASGVGNLVFIDGSMWIMMTMTMMDH